MAHFTLRKLISKHSQCSNTLYKLYKLQQTIIFATDYTMETSTMNIVYEPTLKKRYALLAIVAARKVKI